MMKLYHSVFIQNLMILGPDYARILLNTGYTRWHAKHVPFKLEAKWFFSEEFHNLIKTFGHIILNVPQRIN